MATPDDPDGQTRLSGEQKPVTPIRTRAPLGGQDTGPLSPGRPFGPRYQIIRLLGMGGMGAVYQAWDQELHVTVAVKVIRPDAGADPTEAQNMEARFKRELLLARQVTHRNVVRIHDIGEIEGIKYITMPFIEGEDLVSRLKRKGKLPVGVTLTIARHVVAGLAAAHDAGVVHRDLKPANIMLDLDDRALIMDFGIATLNLPERMAAISPNDTTKPVAAPASPPRPRASDSDTLLTPEPARSTPRVTPAGVALSSMTQGAVVGTLEFMAPEQARGEAVDQRADIYSFGLILTEMLIGRRRRPHGKTVQELLEERIKQLPVSLRATDPSIPEAVDALVMKCLQLNPADRFKTTAELAVALDKLDDNGQLIPEPVVRRFTPAMIAAGVLVVTLLLGATWWFSRSPAAEAAHAPLSILIADFENTTKDPALDGAIEQPLSLALEGASFITAFPRAAAVKLAGTLGSSTRVDEATAQLIAVREGVSVVVAGRIEPRGSGYRLTVRTLDSDGKQTGTVSADASGKSDVLQAVSRLASKLRDAFGDTTPEKLRRADIETFTASSLDAVREYSLAQDLASAGKNEEAITHYRAALAQDPNFGRAYSGWAVVANKVGRSGEAAEAYRQAFNQLGRMTEREKLRTLGAYYLQVTKSYDKAIENYSSLVKQYPADRAGHSNLALGYFYILDFPKALEEARLALQDYPKNSTFRSNYALFAMYNSDFATAATEGKKLVDADATFRKGYLPIAVAAIDAGKLDEASAVYDQMARSGAAGQSLAAEGRGDLAIRVGRYADAISLLDAGLKADLQGKLMDGTIAKYAALADAAIAAGRQADAKKAALAGAALSDDVAAQVSAARVLARVDDAAGARKIANTLAGQIQPQKRGYAKIIEGEIALAHHQAQGAVDALLAAKALTDHWLGRFDLGIAYVEAGNFAEAVSELELAEKRRGEGTALFLDDWPTTRELAALPYWLGRAHEGLSGLAAARTHYEAFLALRPSAQSDPLVVDAKRRLLKIGK
jgi:serine/threonine protein kinase/tetratricopeptide (TPR) repeat protein